MRPSLAAMLLSSTYQQYKTHGINMQIVIIHLNTPAIISWLVTKRIHYCNRL